MKVLVTGASGFMGHHLARRLIALGHVVRVLARRPLADPELKEAEQVVGDLADAGSVASAVDGVQAIFHLAAQRDGWGIPMKTYWAVNVEGTLALLDAAARAGVERVVLCSSVGVARYPGRLDADESLPYSTPTSQVAYHVTKAEAERVTLAAAQAGAVPAVVVRPVITYGPRDQTGMVTQLLIRLKRGQFFPIGDGRSHVHLAYVDDVIAGMVLAWECGTAGRVYILSGPRPTPVRQVIAAACAALGRADLGPLALPTGLAQFAAQVAERAWSGLGRRPPITRDAIATLTVDRGFSHARAAAELGYTPGIELEEGLRRTVGWLQNEMEQGLR